MMQTMLNIWRNDDGQDIAEYALMLAVILILVIGTVKLIGQKANTVFDNVQSALVNP